MIRKGKNKRVHCRQLPGFGDNRTEFHIFHHSGTQTELDFAWDTNQMLSVQGFPYWNRLAKKKKIKLDNGLVINTYHRLF